MEADVGDMVQTAGALVAPENMYALSDVVRHFGYLGLNRAVERGWSDMREEETNEFKTIVISLVRGGTRELGKGKDESNAVKEGLVQLVVSVAKRDWPQRWTNLMEDLVTIAAVDFTRLELVLRVLRSLLTESFVFSQGMPAKRQQQLRAGLSASLPHYYAVICFAMNLAVTGSDGLAQRDAIVMARSAVAALNACLDWAPTELVVDKETTFFASLDHLIQLEDVRMEIVDCLTILVNRRSEGLKLPTDAMRLICAELIKIVDRQMRVVGALEDPEDEDEAVYGRQLAELVANLGSHHAEIFRGGENQQLLYDFLQVMLLLLTHPNQYIVNAIVPLWKSLVRITDAPEIRTMLAQAQPIVLERMADRLAKVGSPDADNSPSCHYASLEFDNEEEFDQFFATMRGSLLEAIRLYVQLEPAAPVAMVMRRVEAAFQAAQKRIGSHGSLAETSPEFIALESAVVLADNVLGMQGIAGAVPTIVAQCSQLLEHLSKFETKDSSMLVMVVSLVKACTTASMGGEANANGDALINNLRSAFAVILRAVRFHGNGNVEQPADVIVARRKARDTFVSLCRHSPTRLAPHLPSLLPIVQEHMRSGELRQVERTGLLEGLLIVSNRLDDANVRGQFVNDVLSTSVGAFVADDVSAFVATPASFTAVLWKFDAAEEAMRTHLLEVVSQCSVLVRAIGAFPGLYPVFNAMLTNLMHLYERVCEVDSSMTTGVITVPDSLRAFTEPSKVDLALARGATTSEVRAVRDAEATEEAAMLRQWMDQVRDATFNLVGRLFACDPAQVFARDDIDNIIRLVFGHMQAMENQRLKSFIKLVANPFFRACPSGLYMTLLREMLPQMLKFFTSRQEATWQHFRSSVQTPNGGGNGGGNAGAVRDAREILLETRTRIVSRDVATLIAGLLDETKSSMMRSFILGHSASCQALLQFLTSAMATPDTQVANRAVMVSAGIMPTLLSVQPYHGLLVNAVLPAVIGVLAQFEDEAVNHTLCYKMLMLLIQALPNECGHVLGLLPDVSAEDVQALLTVVCREDANDRTSRKNIKEFLSDHVSLQGDRAVRGARGNASVAQLPEPLVILGKATKAQVRWDDVIGENLAALFG